MRPRFRLAAPAFPPYGEGFSNQLVDDFGTIPESTPEQVDRARRYVAGQALGVEDARVLLAMLGLGSS